MLVVDWEGEMEGGVYVFTSMSEASDSVTFLERLCDFASDFFDDTGVIATDLSKMY